MKIDYNKLLIRIYQQIGNPQLRYNGFQILYDEQDQYSLDIQSHIEQPGPLQN